MFDTSNPSRSRRQLFYSARGRHRRDCRRPPARATRVSSQFESQAPRYARGACALPALTCSSRCAPPQWTKNLIVFAGLIFGGQLFEPARGEGRWGVRGLLCVVGSGVPHQRHRRPGSRRTASAEEPTPDRFGAISPGVTAVWAAAIARGLGTGVCPWLRDSGSVAIIYLVPFVLYSVALKHLVIIDVLTIAGRVRAAGRRRRGGDQRADQPLAAGLHDAAGAVPGAQQAAPRADAAGGRGHGPPANPLEEYSPYLLDQMISVVTASTLIVYAVYATSAETASTSGNDQLGLTIPFRALRYLPVSVSGAPEARRREPGGRCSSTDRPAAGLCGAVGASAVVLYRYYSPLGTMQ